MTEHIWFILRVASHRDEFDRTGISSSEGIGIVGGGLRFSPYNYVEISEYLVEARTTGRSLGIMIIIVVN